MIEDRAREDIAFIRGAIEEGAAAYATASSPDMLVWGIAVAAGYLATYAFVRGWSPAGPQLVWTVCIGLPWLFSLRRVVGIGGAGAAVHGPMARGLAMLWLGCGICLTTLSVACIGTGESREGWFSAVAAGVMGIGFFGGSWLANLRWMRWVAVGWWLGEIALFALRHRLEAMPLGAALMLLLLAGPGWVLLSRRGARAPEDR